MAQKRRFLDVWIIETNTVYREVPFEIVTDWVQQGRLLADDMLRPSGTAEWFRLGDNPSFSAYLPHAEPFAANDQAEALEPVQSDFVWKRGPGDEDDDVDMIPLIDVSLVLLVFFMMTAAAIATNFQLPPSQRNLLSSNEDMIWIGVHAVQNDPTLSPSYSIGTGSRPPTDENKGLATQAKVIEQLRKLVGHPPPGKTVEVQIKADQTVPFWYVRDLQNLVQAQDRDNEKKDPNEKPEHPLVHVQYWGVSEKK